jgi:crotonobetainyl-CoA:carnitine CoA-transferase CaiB-like acyl-CoA transferase
MLSPYRVLDLSDERGLFCSRILSELGADVIHVEPPGGSPARHGGPHAGGGDDPERSLTWWAMARGTRSVTLDLDDPTDRNRFAALVASAHILIESAEPGTWEARGLGYDQLSAVNPTLVWVSLTPFGSHGPKAHYAATDLIVQASSGAMTVTGNADRAPLRASAVPAWTHAGAEGAGGALIALFEAQRSGRGQRVEVSAQRATNLTAQFSLPAVEVGHRPVPRAGGFSLHGIDFPFIWATADGWVSLTVAMDPMNKPFLDRLLEFMVAEGHGAEGVTDVDWVAHIRLIRSGDRPNTDLVALRDAVAAFIATKTNANLFAAALDRKLLLVPVASFDDLYHSPQLEHREFWTDETLPDGSHALLPGHIVRSTHPRSQDRQPAPSIGQHNDEVLGTLPPNPAAAPPGADVPGATATTQGEPPRPATAPPANASPQAALAGVKVLDMMWVMAGPYSTGILAQYGATVIRVENEARLDTARLLAPWYGGKASKEGSLGFASINPNKLSVTVDPNTDEGREVILDLVRWADVVTESFAPGAMARWGLDYESLRQIKPDLIMISSCLMGQSGPHASVAGYGTMGSAAAGLAQPTGWPDRNPTGPYGAYTDYCAPRMSVTAILAALDHRRRTGEGQYLDQSQVESTLNYAVPALLDHQINGTAWDRRANTDPDLFPHAVYPSAGDDEWVAVACRHDDDWRQLCDVLDRPDWADLDVAERRARGDEIDTAITAWTTPREATATEEALQARGVPAHAVIHSGTPLDPQLAHLNHVVTVSHPDRGEVPVERTRIELTRTPPHLTHFPKLGQHTDQVLTEILGYSPAHITELRRAGALGSARKK